MDWITVFEALKSVYVDEAYSNIAINEAIEHHPECSNGFVRTFVKGVIRDSIKLDHYIDQLAAKGIKGLKNRTLIVLRMGIYAIESMNSVPDHAAVNNAVRLAKKVAKGTDGLVNGILRSFLRRRNEPDIEEQPKDNGYLSLKYSFPEPLIDLISSQYGDDTEDILSALNSPAPLVLRVNPLKTSRDELIAHMGRDMSSEERAERFITEGIPENAIIYTGNAVGTEAFRSGLFSIQSLSSIEAINAFRPVPGSRVLDMCAAPGGKTCAMAELMDNCGEIVSCDIHEHRLGLIEAQAQRLGCSIVSTRLMDGTVPDDTLKESFDYVLADVPCSGLGVIQSKPEIKLRTDVKKYDELTDIQYNILKNALSYVRDGGSIEYSTCTINRSENEAVIDRLIEEFSFVEIIEKKLILPYNNRIGFFYCIMRKNPLEKTLERHI